MPQVAVWLRSWRVCHKKISSEHFWQNYWDTNAWHTPSYTRDRSTVEQNMTHRRIISYPWCGWDGLNNLSAKWDRGRMGGERGQREDRCQMSVCKNKIKYRVEQRFGDTGTFLSAMEGKELWMSGLVPCLCMTCLESIRSDLSADRLFSAGQHWLYKLSIPGSYWRNRIVG